MMNAQGLDLAWIWSSWLADWFWIGVCTLVLFGARIFAWVLLVRFFAQFAIFAARWLASRLRRFGHRLQMTRDKGRRGAIFGKGPPSDDIGAVNQYYYDEQSETWYGPKLASGWFVHSHDMDGDGISPLN